MPTLRQELEDFEQDQRIIEKEVKARVSSQLDVIEEKLKDLKEDVSKKKVLKERYNKFKKIIELVRKKIKIKWR